jgi:hypothetical protein
MKRNYKKIFIFVSIILLINLLITFYFFFHISSPTSTISKTEETKETQKEVNLKIWPELSPKGDQNRLTLVTYARNKAELFWFTDEYQNKLKSLSVEERPFVICVICQLKTDKEEEYLKKYRLKFIKSHDPHCDISRLYKVGLSFVESELFMFIEPGFTFTPDFYSYLTESKLSHQLSDADEQISYMILSFESTAENNEFPKTGEYRKELINLYQQKKIRNFFDLRSYHLYSENVQNYIIPQILEPNMKVLRSNEESIDVPISSKGTSDIKFPRIYWFLLETKKFKFDIMLLLDQLFNNYKHEHYSRSLVTRERIIREMERIQDFKVHLILEKGIFYHKTPRDEGVTLAVHLSFDRVDSLQKTMQRWDVCHFYS